MHFVIFDLHIGRSACVIFLRLIIFIKKIIIISVQIKEIHYNMIFYIQIYLEMILSFGFDYILNIFVLQT